MSAARSSARIIFHSRVPASQRFPASRASISLAVPRDGAKSRKTSTTSSAIISRAMSTGRRSATMGWHRRCASPSAPRSPSPTIRSCRGGCHHRNSSANRNVQRFAYKPEDRNILHDKGLMRGDCLLRGGGVVCPRFLTRLHQLSRPPRIGAAVGDYLPPHSASFVGFWGSQSPPPIFGAVGGHPRNAAGPRAGGG